MKVIVGLGNPGRKYEGTRHNVGWWALDHLADVWHFDRWRSDGESVVADGRLGDMRVRLVKPQTYMNLSGAALRPYTRRLGWSGLQDLLVLVDEVAIPLGTFRLRASGSAGGHNGLKSIEATLGTRDYARLRIGIAPVDEHRQVGDLADFVLDRFGQEERAVVMALLPRITDAVECWARDGIQNAMNLHNRKADP
ncbi:MAG TPA: aminoacyl-tRNA hydrolase [Gemmatimonadaceae bacterium]|nr:MAG: aminoacyl-tRNA hydrolase [Gemmatimonadetes bacterium SCN 70-22]HMN08257.1 aminoacyl-tRNA hydrolase [Gemmatimonadaceae bacterium]